MRSLNNFHKRGENFSVSVLLKGIVDGFEWVYSGVYSPSDDNARNDMWVELDSMRL